MRLANELRASVAPRAENTELQRYSKEERTLQGCAVVESLPIRTRLTVLKDMTVASTSLVFCEREGRSVPLARCVSCPRGGAIWKGPAGREDTIACEVASLSATSTGASPGMAAVVVSSLPIGLAMAREVTCLAPDLPLRQVSTVVPVDPTSFGVPVVDDEGGLLGLLPRASVTIGLPGSSRELVGARMTSPALLAHEQETLGVAFREMCSRRARELVIIGDQGQVVGVLRDVDAMRFVAYVTRTGTRPGIGRAA
jgi:CBS domain-containing protein